MPPCPHPTPDQLRLLVKVARMYHERDVRQPQIAETLRISQSKVSRLLSQAAELGIVRTIVTLPEGVNTELEEDLTRQFDLLDAVVVDTDGSAGDLTPALGAATAGYLADSLTGGDRVGLSSWSATLLAAVNVMRPRPRAALEMVTQLVGGVGDPDVQVQATRILDRFATLTGARPLFLPTPGLVANAGLRTALLQDPAVQRVQESWSELTVALVGIGSVEPSPLLRRSGNAIDPEQQREMKELGAVGDVCFRFFDAAGDLVDSAFDARVLGITPIDLRTIPRRIGVAGGPEKVNAIRASMQGGWVNVLITDARTAQELLLTPSTCRSS